MAVIKVKDWTSSMEFNNYLVKKLGVESIDVISKTLKGMNRQIAREIAKDIISRYDIEVRLDLQQIDIKPRMTIAYRRKRNLALRSRK